MSESIKKPARRRDPRVRFRIDLVMMFAYVWIVYGWAITLGPLGRDFAILHDPAGSVPGFAARIAAAEADLFGARAYGYHLVNMALMYAAMLLVYAFVRLVRPEAFAWLAVLAAVLFMANPAHSEAMLNLTGAVDLLPALAGIAAITAYAWHARRGGPVRGTVWPAATGLGTLLFPQVVGVIPAFILFDMLCGGAGKRFRPGAWAIAAVLFAGGMYAHWEELTAGNFAHMIERIRSLYFLFYPIGFLPETVRMYSVAYWTGYAGASAVILMAGLILWKLRDRAVLFGVLAALAHRLFPGGGEVDPVHLIGGGQLLIANVFYNTAFVLVCGHMLAHPKWRRAIVTGTTLYCALFFGLEIRVISAWRHADRAVEAFQAQVSAIVAAEEGAIIGVLPDYRHYRGAPVMLSESIAYDTPFSTRTAHMAFASMDYAPGLTQKLRLIERNAEFVAIEIPPETPLKGTMGGKYSRTEPLRMTVPIPRDAGVLKTAPWRLEDGAP